MTASTRMTGLFVALALAFFIAGCGGNDDTGSPTTPTPIATTPVTTPTTSLPTPTIAIPTAPTDGGTATCTTKQLVITIRPSPGGNAAGSSYADIVFTNKGPSRCAIYGWPGVSYVGGSNGTQIGAAADRTGSPKQLKLKPGQAALARLREINAGNFGASCKIRDIDGLRIYPPNQNAADFLPHKTQGCGAASVHTLVIGPVVLK